MKVNDQQLILLSKYFADLSKILFASLVIGFFVSGEQAKVDLPVFIGGIIFTLFFLFFSFDLIRLDQSK